MKKFLSTFVAFLLAFMMMYAGSGINAYSFCCEDCHTFGVEAIVGEKCCDVHKDDCATGDKNVTENAFCDSSHQQCELDRLDIDLPDTSSQKSDLQDHIQITNIPFTIILFQIAQNLEFQPTTFFISETQKPPNISKEVYFSLLETLII